MIIGDHFGGIYTGEDVAKDTAKYLSVLRDYNNGQYYESERAIYKKPIIPDGYNIDIRPTSQAFQKLPVRERKKIQKFWLQEINKCKVGVGPICGLAYGYNSFCKLRGGKGDTQYRRFDNMYFKLLEERMWGDKRGNGIIEIGRRRSGKSSKIMWFVLQCLRTMSNIDIAVSSKTEADAERVLVGEKAQFMYMHLPLALKPSQLKTNAGELHLGKKDKDAAGNYMVTGRNSKVVGLSPKAEALEGSTLQVWIHDEMGKTKGLQDLYNMTSPALADMNGIVREGLIILTGVAGDRGKFEDDLVLWKSADEENLTRVFSPGWTSLFLNEFGEEDVAKGVEYILNLRHAVIKNKTLSTSKKEAKLAALNQQYPLTIDEAFLATTGGKWNNIKINGQKSYLDECPAEIIRGDCEWNIPNVTPVFAPSNEGKVGILEHPVKGAKYISSIDCYGLKQSDSGSEGAQWIWKLKNESLNPIEVERLLFALGDPEATPEFRLATHLNLGHLPVAYYVDSPKDPSVYADRAAALAAYYSRYQNEPVKVLPETEPPSILERFLKVYKNRLMRAPLPSNKILTKNDFRKWGIPMKGYWTDIKYEMISHYIENYIDRVYFEELLTKFTTYDETNKLKKWDEVDSFGISLIMAEDKRIKEWNNQSTKKKSDEEDEEDDQIIPFTRR